MSDVYLIAEMSANHNGSLRRAKEIICAAAGSGANAIKFQTYTADTLTLNSDREDFIVPDGLWKGRTLYELYSEGSLPWEWHSELFEYSKRLNLDVISTPFDVTAVDFLVDLKVDKLKIASFELVDIPLIKKVARANLPVIISCGMANEKEIGEALEILEGSDVTLLHCISKYPASAADANLTFINDLQRKYGGTVGLSDHCIENTIAAASVALGVRVIEKHFTLDRDAGGLDDSFSQTPESFSQLRKMCDDVSFGMAVQATRADSTSKRYRKSVYAAARIEKGEIFTPSNIRVVRPGFGIHPRYYDTLIGKPAKCEYDLGQRIEDVEIL